MDRFKGGKSGSVSVPASLQKSERPVHIDIGPRAQGAPLASDQDILEVELAVILDTHPAARSSMARE